jgi:hypothetical protein
VRHEKIERRDKRKEEKKFKGIEEHKSDYFGDGEKLSLFFL